MNRTIIGGKKKKRYKTRSYAMRFNKSADIFLYIFKWFLLNALFKKVIHILILKPDGDYSVPLCKYLHCVVVIWHLLKQVMLQPLEDNLYICTVSKKHLL